MTPYTHAPAVEKGSRRFALCGWPLAGGDATADEPPKVECPLCRRLLVEAYRKCDRVTVRDLQVLRGTAKVRRSARGRLVVSAVTPEFRRRDLASPQDPIALSELLDRINKPAREVPCRSPT